MSCIISTSGREKSVTRYKALLKGLAITDVKYQVFVSSTAGSTVITPEEFTAAIKSKDAPCIGAAISKDIKGKIIPFLDKLDETAVEVQSVNTIVHDSKGLLTGYNTDAFGFRQAIHGAIEEAANKYGRSCKNAIVYGYGGVTSVVVHVLRALRVENIYLAGRNLGKARERAAELGCLVWEPCSASASASASPSPSPSPSPCDIFVNASPVTDTPLEAAENFMTSLTGSGGGGPCVVFDHEMPGQCLKDWAIGQEKLVYVSGYEMYYPQMKRQWELFLGGRASRQDISTALDSLIREEKEKEKEEEEEKGQGEK